MVLSTTSGNKLNEFIAVLFILDPESTSLVPDKAFSTENAENVLKIISDKKYLSFHLKIIHDVPPGTNKTTGTTKPSNVPVIAGVAGGFVVIIVLVISIYTHKQRQKR